MPSVRRPALTVLLALLLGALSVLASPPPVAQADDGDLTVEIAGVSPAVLRSDDTLTVTGRVTNATDDELDPPTIRLAMQLHVPASREALAAWLDGTSSLNTSVLAVAAVEGPIPAGGSVSFSIQLETAGGTFSEFSAWGPRGVEIQATTAGLSASARTTLLWYPTDPPLDAPSDLAVLVPLTPTAQEWRTAVAEQVPVGEAAADRLLAVLDAVGPDVSLAIDPVLLETVVPATTPAGEDGATEDADATDDATTDDAGDGSVAVGATQSELLARLTAASGHTLLSLGYADADLTALALHDGAALWDAGVSRGRELFEAAGLEIESIAWPGATVSTEALDVLAASGVQAVVLEGAAPTLGEVSSARALLADGPAGMQALVADPGLGTALTTGAGAGAQGRQALLALSAVTTRAQPQGSAATLIALPRDIGTSTTALAELADRLGALREAPWLQLQGADALLEDATASGSRVEVPQDVTSPGGLTAADIAALSEGRDVVAAYAQAAGSTIVTGHLPGLLAPLSSALTGESTLRRQLLEAAVAGTDELASSIRVESSSDRWLISDAGAMPVTITNSLDVPATVSVELAPTQPWLQVPEVPEYTLAAGTSETYRIPISSVTNGDAIVEVHVTPEPGGPDLAAPASFSLRVRADWENIGTGVVAGLLLVAFVVGLVRTIRRGGRRAEAR